MCESTGSELPSPLENKNCNIIIFSEIFILTQIGKTNPLRHALDASVATDGFIIGSSVG